MWQESGATQQLREENKRFAQQKGRLPRYWVQTYGCAQNENDSEALRGILQTLGYVPAAESEEADLILFNTCAVRDNAEQRVYGNIGALKHRKEREPSLMIGVCGCMMQQEHVAENIRKRFRHIDFVFGTQRIHRLPDILWEARSSRVFDLEQDNSIVEGLPHDRTSRVSASVAIMYGCDNFCSYCVVPYVRGRERSRCPEEILSEVRALAADGCREVTLLGQNVNSYGKGLSEPINFPALLRQIAAVEGIERIRFISSHPKDFTDELIAVMAEEPKVCRQLHLPFQSGSDRVLGEMNRRYTSADYLRKMEKVKKAIPDVTTTSDVIVGFPTETQEDFEATLRLIREVEFDTLFTFIYSPRVGTPAAKMPFAMTEEQIKENFQRLLDVQNEISLKKNKALLGTVQTVLVEGRSKGDESKMTGRTEGNKIVNFDGDDSLVGKLILMRIVEAATWSLTGEPIGKAE